MKNYAGCIFFDQYHNIKIQKGKGRLLDPYLVFPDIVDMRKPVPRLDMVDTRTGVTVRETVLMMKNYFREKNRIFESIKHRPEAED